MDEYQASLLVMQNDILIRQAEAMETANALALAQMYFQTGRHDKADKLIKEVAGK